MPCEKDYHKFPQQRLIRYSLTLISSFFKNPHFSSISFHIHVFLSATTTTPSIITTHHNPRSTSLHPHTHAHIRTYTATLPSLPWSTHLHHLHYTITPLSLSNLLSNQHSSSSSSPHYSIIITIVPYSASPRHDFLVSWLHYITLPSPWIPKHYVLDQ